MYQNFGSTFTTYRGSQVYVGSISSGGTTSTILNWFQWDKPARCKMVNITCIGGAGGGGGGSAVSLSSAGGGGGGGAGAITNALFIARSLPGVLYVSPGKGGAGGTGQVIAGAAATAGSAGSHSIVSANPGAYLVQNTICIGIGGSGGAVAQTGGAGGSASSAANASFLALASFSTLNAQAGGAGGATDAGTSIAWSDASLFWTFNSSGAGGAGEASGTTIATGGGISVGTSSIITPLTTSASEGSRGPDGYNYYQSPDLDFPWFSTGGCGGTSSLVITGGNGGDGGISSGGGGGAGSAAVAGGNGGNGGPGIVIITCW